MLTDRQREMLRHVADGLSDEEIADRMNVTGYFVSRCLSDCRRVLGCEGCTREGLVQMARMAGVLE